MDHSATNKTSKVTATKQKRMSHAIKYCVHGHRHRPEVCRICRPGNFCSDATHHKKAHSIRKQSCPRCPQSSMRCNKKEHTAYRRMPKDKLLKARCPGCITDKGQAKPKRKTKEPKELHGFKNNARRELCENPVHVGYRTAPGDPLFKNKCLGCKEELAAAGPPRESTQTHAAASFTLGVTSTSPPSVPVPSPPTLRADDGRHLLVSQASPLSFMTSPAPLSPPFEGFNSPPSPLASPIPPPPALLGFEDAASSWALLSPSPPPSSSFPEIGEEHFDPDQEDTAGDIEGPTPDDGFVFGTRVGSLGPIRTPDLRDSESETEPMGEPFGDQPEDDETENLNLNLVGTGATWSGDSDSEWWWLHTETETRMPPFFVTHQRVGFDELQVEPEGCGEEVEG